MSEHSQNSNSVDNSGEQISLGANTAELFDRLNVIANQPLADRAIALEQLHSELSAELGS